VIADVRRKYMPSDIHPSDTFCFRDADEGLRHAVCQPNAQAAIRRWCRDNPDKLRLALDWIFPHHRDYREIVSLELDDLRRKEQEEKYKEIHGRLTALEKPHWTTTPGFLISAISFLILLIATYFAWLAIPSEHRPFFREQSSKNTNSLLSLVQPDTSQDPAQPE